MRDDRSCAVREPVWNFPSKPCDTLAIRLGNP
jgi:hypothetical protein